MSSNDVQRAVVRTLCAFDQWLYAPTPTELSERCIEPPKGMGILELEEALEALERNGVVMRQNGCVALTSRGSLVERMSNYAQESFTKWRRAQRAVRLLRFIPFLKMVAITNTVAMDAADEASDIDVLIVGGAGRLWSVRFFVAAVLEVAGLRRHGTSIRDRICLSFFLSDRHWSLEPFVLADDPLYAFWVSFTTVVFAPDLEDASGAFAKHNTWVKKYLPNHEWKILNTVRAVKDSPICRGGREVLEWIMGGSLGDGLEWVLRAYQRQRIYAHAYSRVHHKGVDVVVNDNVLKFHESDAREQMCQRWQHQVKEIMAEAGV